MIPVFRIRTHLVDTGPRRLRNIPNATIPKLLHNIKICVFDWQIFFLYETNRCSFAMNDGAPRNLLSIYPKMSPLFFVCVRGTFEKGNPHRRGLVFEKKYPTNAESWIMEGRFLDQPDREHGNPLKPVRARDDVGGKTWPMRSSPDFGEFPLPWGSISFDSFDFRQIRRCDVTTKTITIELYVI